MDSPFVKILDVSFLYQEEAFLKHYSLMPEYRRKKIDFFAFKKDKTLSLGAGILMEELIDFAREKYGGSYEVAFSEKGKPYFKNNDKLHFSLAHSGKKVMAALSEEIIGVDLEEIKENPDINLYEWTKAESYSKAMDIPLSDYLEGKITLPSDSHFYQWTDDGYLYAIFSTSNLSTSTFLFPSLL